MTFRWTAITFDGGGDHFFDMGSGSMCAKVFLLPTVGLQKWANDRAPDNVLASHAPLATRIPEGKLAPPDDTLHQLRKIS